MSYSVVLVEDEELTLQELETTTDWQKFDMHVIGTATNGMDGEQLIKALEPDIVITDIRLPGQDGLEMLSHCPVNYAIILSGHSDFSYMQKAIRLSVFDFLLKPVADEDLEHTLANLSERIQEEDDEMDRMKKQTDTSGCITLPVKVSNRIVDAAIQFINNHYHHSIGLQETCDHLSVSESHLCRLFKECTGINFLYSLNAYRINKAIEMMKDHSITIQQISAGNGFPSSGYFAKIFKKYTGVLPSQYRDQNSML